MTDYDDGFAAGREAGINEALAAVQAALGTTTRVLPVDAMPQSYIVGRVCRCGRSHLTRACPSCPACVDHLDLPALAERSG